jgi:hypothetical protein
LGWQCISRQSRINGMLTRRRRRKLKPHYDQRRARLLTLTPATNENISFHHLKGDDEQQRDANEIRRRVGSGKRRVQKRYPGR